MKDNKSIQDNLRNLPKHSLTSEQKERVLLKIKGEQFSKSKRRVLRPLIAVIASFAIVSILVLHELNNRNMGSDPANLPEPNLVELTAPMGEVFMNRRTEVIGIENNVALINTGPFVAEDHRVRFIIVSLFQ